MHGQECPLDPRDRAATIGGIVACGLSGIRRLRHGPLRDHVLEVRFVTADGRLVKGGGQTVKNVTGYDLPRLLVGSFGTLGVLVQLTLRCRPRAESARWFRVDARDRGLGRTSTGRRRCSGTGTTTHVLLEGVTGRRRRRKPPDCPRSTHRRSRSARTAAGSRSRPARSPPSVARSTTVPGRGGAQSSASGRCTSPATTPRCSRGRTVAHAHGGWLLREAGGAGIDGFGCELPNAALMRRVKDAFDPTGKLAPGRLPL